MDLTLACLLIVIAAALGYLAGMGKPKRRRSVPLDITPGWQERAEELRRLLRECKHDGWRERNAEGREFCAICSRYMDDVEESG